MADATLIPLEVLFGNPERVGAQISPDGTRLSYLAPLDGVLNVPLHRPDRVPAARRMHVVIHQRQRR